MNAPGAEGSEIARADTARWARADAGTPAAREALVRDVEAIVARGAEASLLHDPAWLLDAEGRRADDVEIYVLRRDGAACAYAPFIWQPWSLRFRLGEVTLFSVRMRRLHMNNGPVLAEDAGAAGWIQALFAQLRPRLGAGQALYLEGVPVGSPVDRVIGGDALRALYRVVEPSPRYERQLIRFPASFDAYMQSLKTNTRQNLRNSQRKLERHLAGDVRLVTCATTADVPAFVAKATAVSRKTYQWHLLGLGLRDAAQLERTLTAMAERRWTRSYLLECKGEPVAFMLGYLYRGTYYYVDVGFDADWGKWSVGTILHLEVFRDLIDGPVKASSFDFSSGTGVHKERFGNESRAEANYLLLPRTVRNAMLVATYRAATAMTDGAVRLADRFGLKTRIKKLLRRRSTAGPDAS